MTRLVPMPSPRGTNFERRFIPEHWVTPANPPAMDAMPTTMSRRPMRDQEGLPDHIDHEFALRIIREVMARVAPDERVKLAQRIPELLEGYVSESERNGMDRRLRGVDQPPPFRGMSRPGDKMTGDFPAQDSAFFERHPDARRIKIGGL